MSSECSHDFAANLVGICLVGKRPMVRLSLDAVRLEKLVPGWGSGSVDGCAKTRQRRRRCQLCGSAMVLPKRLEVGCR